MKFPEIPTDNLYKFMALSGIVIIIVAFVPFFFQHKLHIQTIQLAGEKLLLNNERDTFLKKIEIKLVNIDSMKKSLRSLDENFVQKINKKRMSITEFKWLSDKVNNLGDATSGLGGETIEIVDELKQLKTLTIQIAIKEFEIKYINSVIIKGIRLFYFGALVGITITFIGFSLWYKKLQVPLDMIIKNKLKDK